MNEHVLSYVVGFALFAVLIGVVSLVIKFAMQILFGLNPRLSPLANTVLIVYIAFGAFDAMTRPFVEEFVVTYAEYLAVFLAESALAALVLAFFIRRRVTTVGGETIRFGPALAAVAIQTALVVGPLLYWQSKT